MHMCIKSGLLPQNRKGIIGLCIANFKEKVKNQTLNGNCEGLLWATELEQSSKYTLDNMAYLSWVFFLNSQHFSNAILKRCCTCPKKALLQNDT